MFDQLQRPSDHDHESQRRNGALVTPFTATDAMHNHVAGHLVPTLLSAYANDIPVAFVMI